MQKILTISQQANQIFLNYQQFIENIMQINNDFNEKFVAKFNVNFLNKECFPFKNFFYYNTLMTSQIRNLC